MFLNELKCLSEWPACFFLEISADLCLGQRGETMNDFFEIKCLGKKEQKKILSEIEQKIVEKKKSGLLTEREIREIEEMKLRPLPDIQDVQSVYENFLFKKN